MQRVKKALRSLRSRLSFAKSAQWQEHEDPDEHQPSPPVRWGFGSIILVLAALALVVTASIVHLQREEVREAEEVVEQFELSQILQPNSRALQVISRIAQRQPFSEGRLTLLEFNVQEEYRIARLFSEEVRQQVLIPALKKSLAHAEGRLKSLYLMALLYSSHDNELGQLIRSNTGEWTETLGLPASLITSYVELNEEPWHRALSSQELGAIMAPPSPPELENWERFARTIQDAVDKPYLLQPALTTLQQSARTLMEQEGVLAGGGRAAEIYRYLRDMPQANMEDLFEKEVRFVQWESSHRPEINHFLSHVDQARLERVPVASMTTQQFLSELQSLAALKPGLDRSLRLDFQSDTAPVPGWAWEDVLKNSQLHHLVHEFVSEKGSGSKAFLLPPSGSFADLEWDSTCVDCGFIEAEARLAGDYSKAAVQGFVVPILQGFEELFGKGLIPEQDEARLVEFLNQSVTDYAKAYGEAHEAFYTAFSTSVDSPSRLKIYLMQLQGESSPLVDFLSTLMEETRLEFPSSPLTQPLLRQAGEYAFVQRLFQTEPTGLVRLEGYEQLLGDLEQQLYGDPKEGRTEPLADLLTPLGRFVLDLMETPNASHWSRATAWLEREGIPEAYRAPFVDPLKHAVALGARELAGNVERRWEDELLPELAPLASRYPFNSAASEEVTPTELSQVLQPNSRFWLSFRRYLEPFLVREEGYWDAREVQGEQLPIPPDILCTVSRLRHLQEILWDSSGNPKPMRLAVKPVPMEATAGDEVMLGYIHTGGSSVYLFNQAPDWQEIALEWWKEQGSTVGITVVNRDSREETVRSLEVPESPWSLLKLLQKAERDEEGVLTWQVPSETLDSEQTVQRVPFELREEPLDLFEVDCGGRFSR